MQFIIESNLSQLLHAMQFMLQRNLASVIFEGGKLSQLSCHVILVNKENWLSVTMSVNLFERSFITSLIFRPINQPETMETIKMHLEEADKSDYDCSGAFPLIMETILSKRKQLWL